MAEDFDSRNILVDGNNANNKGKIDAQGNVHTKIDFQDTNSLGAFGRLRMSAPFGIFDNKNVLSKNETLWSELTNGTSSITHLINESSVQLEAGTEADAYAIRQSLKYCAYVPGKSQVIFMTGVLGAPKVNNVTRIGYFDDDDGLFFEQSESGLGVVLRTSTSGSPVDTRIDQANWSVDPMDGTGPSGVTLDPTKTQIFVIDFQWLGVGRIRFSLDIDGILYKVHEINNANLQTEVYMKTPTLPVRYETRNTGITASPTILKEICCSVASEGGYSLPGLEFSEIRTTRRSVSTRTPVFAIRLTNTFNSVANRKTARMLTAVFNTTSRDAIFEVIHAHTPNTVTGTFTPVGGDSGIEYSTDITAITSSHLHPVIKTIVASGQGGSAGTGGTSSDFISEHSFLYQNFDSTNSQVFVVYATGLGGTANVIAGLSWIEFI